MKQHKGITVGLWLSVLVFPIVTSGQPCPRVWLAPEKVEELSGILRDSTPGVTATLTGIFFERNRAIYWSDRANSNVPWGMPVSGGVLNFPVGPQFSPYLSADSLTIWWQRAALGFEWQIWTATRPAVGPPWENAHEVSELTATNIYTGSPVVSFDELTIWFESTRTPSIGGADIFVATRAAKTDPWSNITHLGGVINTTQDDTPGWISLDELTLWLGSGDSGSTRIYTSSRASRSDSWETPVEVIELNVNAQTHDPTLSPDELIIWFGAGPVDTEQDIWSSIAETAGCPWDVNLDGVVDPLDAGFVMARFGCTPFDDFTQNPGCFRANQNSDDAVDPLDSGIILANFGPCPGCE